MTTSAAVPSELSHLAVPITSLVEDPANARLHGERNMAAIKASLQRFGQRVPIVVQKQGMVVRAGNARLRAARELGWTEIAALVVDENDVQATAYATADNRTAELAEWDTEVLAKQLAALAAEDIDLGELGFSDADMAGLGIDTDPATIQDEVPPVRPEVITNPGDLYELGAHRLLCSDSTKPENVARLMDGQKAILFATDPPYLVDYDGTNHPHKWNDADKNKDWSETYGVTWDDASGNPDLYDGFIAQAVALALQPNAAWYCWHASRRQSMLESIWEKHGAFVHCQIVWAKDRPILTRTWYMWQHEPCFMGWVRPNKPPRVSDDYPATVWNIPTVPAGQHNEHPTVKPVEVFAIPMRQHTRPGDICYEPFCGSGTQIISAEELGRRCFAMEISGAYVDVSVRRWLALTGGRVIRNGEDITDAFALGRSEQKPEQSVESVA